MSSNPSSPTPVPSAPAAPPAAGPRTLTAYRILAYATGVLLLVLVLVAMPLKYVGDDPHWVEIIGPVHGWLYFFYVVAAVALAMQLRWRLGRALLIVLAGTVPFASFVAERAVVAEARRASR